MRTTMRTRACGLLAAIALLPAAGAVAADFPQRTALLARSAEAGLDVARVPLLRRLAGPGATQALDTVTARFTASADSVHTRGTAERFDEPRVQSLVGDGWFLHVQGDGTRVRYRNYGALDGKAALARPVADRLTNPVLEEWGRRFVTTRLAGLVALGPGEELVPLFTEHQISGSQAVGVVVGPPVEEVVASTVVFGRRVHGVHVTGPGSKVAVLFANDGEPVGFDYDWARYQPVGRQQDVLGMQAVRQRAQGVTAVELEAPGVTVERTECGYYDAGARKSAGDVLQAACAFHYTQDGPASGASGRRTTGAFVDVVPAGAVIEPDDAWPQALRLTAGTPPEAEALPTRTE
jgi:hypothetical protein